MNIRLLKASILAGFILLPLPALSADIDKRQAELKAIQAQINKQKNTLQDTSRQREKLQALLKQDEKAIAHSAQKVNQSKQSLNAINKKLTELTQEQTRLERDKIGQQATLSRQLSSAYLAGNHDYTKMMLNQQNPATIERMLAYYQYLNKARMNAITELKITLTQLNQVKTSQINTQQKLNALVITQQKQAKNLTKEQNQRQHTLTQLQRTLNTKGAELEQLQIEEASIKRVVQQALIASKASKATPAMDGLNVSKTKLPWPTKGRLNTKFGSSRSGQINWKGVILSAAEGQAVNAVAAGRVIYADWLRGFGMVMVVDHGKGFMSLYGHAQALLKKPGDKINRGETIALVGRSGGRTEPGLYFEIRNKGQAVNPANYCR
ncbi:peptidoglycan DD-metalloendopeptidase family protein [Shewanella sp. SR44-3]|uniref:murein hydrolase activator EnvC family protein n=1 Tax=unclassified Shewanella TaxID=196818 RepID=UPI0015FBFA96|nr:peptidoglycan DD-metalloendopeptidase family protein [Shewanella sp. SR44-3]MBB1268491.1 peptidoglycan DD-metalloendopeptidase family protein [Shewanella sp. SR44-3]